MDYFDVKLSQKTFYSKIISARAAVFHLRGIKSRGPFFYFFFWKLTFLCEIAKENEPFFIYAGSNVRLKHLKKMEIEVFRVNSE